MAKADKKKATAKTKAQVVVATKPAPKSAAKQTVTTKVAPAKAAAKPVAKPSPVKPTKAAAVPVKSAKSAKAVKPAAKVATPAPVAAKAKPAPKAPVPKASAKPVGLKAAKSTPAPAAKPAKVSKAPAATPAKAGKAKVATPAKAVAAKPTPKPAPTPAPVAAKPTKPVKAVKGKKVAAAEPEVVVEVAPEKGRKAKGKDAEKTGGEFFQGSFFFEVAVGSATVRKVKTSIVQAAPTSKKAAKDEETHDELLARIERDLQKARVIVRRGPRSMVCTKCCIMPVDDMFIVDRDTAYCTECALMLGLGHTREARHQNFHPSLMKGEEAEEE